MSEQDNLHEYKDVLVSGIDYDFSRSPHENIPRRLYMDWAALVIKLAKAGDRLFIAPPFPEALEFQTKSIHSNGLFWSDPDSYMLDWFFCDLMAANNGGLRIGFEKGRRGGDDQVRMVTFGFHPGVSSTILKEARAPLASVSVWHGDEQSSKIAEIIAAHRTACLSGPVPYPAHDDSSDAGKCALCGPMPDDVIVNVSRDDFFFDPTYQLTRRVFGTTPETDIRSCPRCGDRFRWIDMPQYYGSGDHCEERFIRVPAEFVMRNQVSNSLDDDARAAKREAEIETARAQQAFGIMESHFASAGLVMNHNELPKDWSQFCSLCSRNLIELLEKGFLHAKLLKALLAELVDFMRMSFGQDFTDKFYKLLEAFDSRYTWLRPFLPESEQYKISGMEERREEMRLENEEEAERFRDGQMSY